MESSMKVAFDVDGTLFNNKENDPTPSPGHWHPLINPRPVMVKKLMTHSNAGDHVIVWSREGKDHADNAVAVLGVGQYVNETMAKTPAQGVDLCYDDEPWLMHNMATKVVPV